MSEVANIFDNGPISPIARIKDNLSIYTDKAWSHYQIGFMEPMPRSSPFIVEMVAASGAVAIAANGQIAKQIVAILQVLDNELLHVRFEPLDDVDGVIWEKSGTARFNSRNTHARVSRFTHLRDPWLATSTFFIMGFQRDMNLEVRNPNPIALPQARFQFWGIRYVLSPLVVDLSQLPEAERVSVQRLLSRGDKETVAKWIGPTTWLPAEGM